MASANKLTLFIVIFMLAGILSGAAIHEYASSDAIQAWSENITLLTDIFLRLIKMVIAPLVFSTVLTPKSWTVKHEAHRSGFDIQLDSDLLISG